MNNEFFKDYTNLINGIDAIAKNKEGYGYTYLELTPLLDIVQPKLKENNFILVQTMKQMQGTIKRVIKEPSVHENKTTHNREIEGVEEKEIESPCYALCSSLIHISGEKIECEMPLYVDDIDPQAIGSAETYMRRYSIYSLLQIKVKDDDGLAGSTKGKTNKMIMETKAPLPQDINEIANFLMHQENPDKYYREIKNREDIPYDLKKKLNKIMYPG